MTKIKVFTKKPQQEWEALEIANDYREIQKITGGYFEVLELSSPEGGTISSICE